jgi:hypothetical protein
VRSLSCIVVAEVAKYHSSSGRAAVDATSVFAPGASHPAPRIQTSLASYSPFELALVLVIQDHGLAKIRGLVRVEPLLQPGVQSEELAGEQARSQLREIPAV